MSNQPVSLEDAGIPASSDLRETEDEATAREDAQRIENERRLAEFDASVEGFTLCRVPGCSHALEPVTGLCGRHASVLRLIEAEAVAGQRLADGRTVREFVESYIAQRTD